MFIIQGAKCQHSNKNTTYLLTLSPCFIDGVLLAFLAVSGTFWKVLVLSLFSPYVIPQGKRVAYPLKNIS